ncbi:MAG: DUF4407 domain-containing protein, partial [Catalinimonas sp.]
AEVNEILPRKTREIDREITALDSLIAGKEAERLALLKAIDEQPFIKTYTSATKYYNTQKEGRDGTLKDTLERRTEYTRVNVENPKVKQIAPLEAQVAALRERKDRKQNDRLSIRNDIEQALSERTGLLDEINVLFAILLSSRVALAVWICLFTFFLAIELFVLVSKAGDKENDYDRVVSHQVNTRIKRLEALESGASR